jgi:uncharacterized repeat protein (TIGR01451 family)
LGATGAALQFDPHTVDALLSALIGVQVGPLAGNDSLTLVNPSGLGALPIAYDGGPGSNTLTLTQSTVASAMCTYNDGQSGTLNLDGEPITFADTTLIADGDTNANETFNLPASASAGLQDDGTANNDISEITSPNGTSVTTTFLNPSGSLTINTSGGSQVQLGAMDNGFGPIRETFSGQAGDFFQVVSAQAVPIVTSVTLTTATLDLAGLGPTFDALDGNGVITDLTAGTTAVLTVGAGGGNGTFWGIILDGSGAVALTKSGAGTETLSGANSYSGATTIHSGTLQVGATNAIPGTSDLAISTGLFDLAGHSDSVGALSGGGLVTSSVAGAVTLNLGATNSSALFTGVITNGSGTLALTKTGSGTQTLSAASAYSGATIISAGTLQLGAVNAIPAGSDVIDNATLDLAGQPDLIGALVGNGTVTSSVPGFATLTVGRTGNSGAFAGVLTNGSGTVSLSKIGGGTERITGAGNSYTGATTVDAGILEVDGAIVSGVNISGTGTLDGTGRTGSVTAIAGTLAPGRSTGTLRTGSLNLQAGSAFRAFIGGNVVGSYTQDSAVSATVTLDTTGVGVALNLLSSASYRPQVGDTYILINNAGPSTVSGTFVAGAGIDAVPAGTPLPEGTLLSANFLGTGLPATITYKAGNNNDSVAIVVHPDLTVAIGSPSLSITTGGPVQYTVNYSDFGGDFQSSTLTTSNVHIVATGTATGTLSFDNGTGATRTVTISNITGDGTLGISVDAGSSIDAAGNPALASGPSPTFIVDNTPPSITISKPSSAYTAGGPITYTVSYADANFASSNLTASNITLNHTGTANGTIGVSGSGLSYTVMISNITGDGSLGFSIAAGTAVDQVGNVALAAGPGPAVIVDNTAPTIAIGKPSAAYAAGGPITYSVRYADAHFGSSNLTPGDITLNATGTASGSISVSGTGTTYTVTISGITGDGSLGISIAANTAVDLAGNEAPAAGPSGTFIVDNTPPTVSISAPSQPITAGGPVTYTVTYSDANFGSSNLLSNEVTLNRTGTANGTIGVSFLGASYAVTIRGITGDGTLGISIAANTAVDLAGNESPATGPSPTFIVDNTAPSATISSPSKSIAAGGPVTYTVSYADANFASSNLTPGSITLNRTGTATGVIGVSGSGTSYVVTISGITGDGTLGISLAANTAVDLAGNATSAAGPSRTFVVDNTPPTITIGKPSAAYTAAGPISYAVSYADAHFGSTSLSLSDITLNATGTATGTVSLSGSGASYKVTISNITGEGNLSISIAPGTAVDLAGNEALDAGPSGAVIVDDMAPTVTISNPSAAYATGGPIIYLVTYASPTFASSNLTASDITLNTTGTANGTLNVSGAGMSYIVTINSITGDGTLGISIAAGTAVDLAGNPAIPAGPSATFLVDNTPPSLSIGTPSKSITAGGPVTYTVSYADANLASSNLTASSITLNATGTASGKIGVSGSGTSYTVTISNITGNGSLGISIAAGTASDLAGNKAPPSGASGTFIVDNATPTVALSTPSKSITSHGPITYTVSYADAHFVSSSLSPGDITLNATGTATGTLGVSGSGTAYTVTISNITGDGSLGISIAAGTAVDLVGNEAPAVGPSTTFVVDNTAPTVILSAPSKPITAHGPISYTVSYADADFASSSLTASNIALNTTGTASGIIGVTGSSLSYTVTISNITGDGSLGISIAADTAVDLAGNVAPAPAPGNSFLVDNTLPAMTLSGPSAPYTAGGPISYTVSYADANFGSSSLTPGNITLNTTGSASGTIGVSGSGTSYTVTISGITGNGTLGISLAANTAVDLAGNQAPAAGPASTFLVDNTPPSIAIGNPSAAYTAGGPVSYTVNYADAHLVSSSLTPGDITLNTTGTATGTIDISGSGTSYVVTISNITGDGSLGFSIAANTAIDLAGNEAPAASPSRTFMVDNTPPTITLSTPSISLTTGGPISYTISYADANFISSTLSTANVHLMSTGTAWGVLGFDSGTGTARTVTISNVTGDGTLGIAIDAGSAADLVGNHPPAAGPSSTFVVDNTPPTITISPPSASSTLAGSVQYTITYSDLHLNVNSISLATADVVLNSTNIHQKEDVSVSGTGATRTVTLSHFTGGKGVMGISIIGGTAFDLAGNAAPATAQSTTFQITGAPRLKITPSFTASVLPGNTLVYTLTITNKGTQTALGMTIQETPPAGTVFTPTNNPGWRPGPNNSFLFDLGDLAAGKSRKISFQLTVPSSAGPGTALVDALWVTDSLGLEARTTLKTTIQKPYSGRWTPGRRTELP